MNTERITVLGKEFSVTTITPMRGHKWYRLTGDSGETLRAYRPATVGSSGRMLLVDDSGRGVAAGFERVWLDDQGAALEVVS